MVKLRQSRGATKHGERFKIRTRSRSFSNVALSDRGARVSTSDADNFSEGVVGIMTDPLRLWRRRLFILSQEAAHSPRRPRAAA